MDSSLRNSWQLWLQGWAVSQAPSARWNLFGCCESPYGLRKFEERGLQFLWHFHWLAISQRNWSDPIDVLYHYRLDPVIVSHYCWPGTGICTGASFLVVISDRFIGRSASGRDRFSCGMLCGEGTTLRPHCFLVILDGPWFIDHVDSSRATVVFFHGDFLPVLPVIFLFGWNKCHQSEVFSIISFLETALYSAIYFLIVVIAPWSQKSQVSQDAGREPVRFFFFEDQMSVFETR